MRHGATIGYQRSMRPQAGHALLCEGNDFHVQLRTSLDVTQPMPLMSLNSRF
jgi:hypothetical protein